MSFIIGNILLIWLISSFISPLKVVSLVISIFIFISSLFLFCSFLAFFPFFEFDSFSFFLFFASLLEMIVVFLIDEFFVSFQFFAPGFLVLILSFLKCLSVKMMFLLIIAGSTAKCPRFGLWLPTIGGPFRRFNSLHPHLIILLPIVFIPQNMICTRHALKALCCNLAILLHIWMQLLGQLIKALLYLRATCILWYIQDTVIVCVWIYLGIRKVPCCGRIA